MGNQVSVAPNGINVAVFDFREPKNSNVTQDFTSDPQYTPLDHLNIDGLNNNHYDALQLNGQTGKSSIGALRSASHQSHLAKANPPSLEKTASQTLPEGKDLCLF